MTTKMDNPVPSYSGFNDDDLRIIREWDIKQGYSGLLLLVGELIYPYGVLTKEKAGVFKIEFNDTPNGNKLVQALRQHNNFWQTCWYSSTRNYVFVFEIPVKFL